MYNIWENHFGTSRENFPKMEITPFGHHISNQDYYWEFIENKDSQGK